ncbi:hypothetical protein GMMP15_740039 [Candidatus Magnetomoraceae bacterium gMMP-15]
MISSVFKSAKSVKSIESAIQTTYIKKGGEFFKVINRQAKHFFNNSK